jgi:hypothetical protein
MICERVDNMINMIYPERLRFHISGEGNCHPYFKPIRANLIVDYNGMHILVKVTGVDIHICNTNHEYNFCLDTKQDKAGKMNWQEIINETVTASLNYLRLDAINHIEYLKKYGEYYAQ